LNSQNILGLDPGRDKCGVAVIRVIDNKREAVFYQVIDAAKAIATIKFLAQKYAIDLIVMGNGTTSQAWQHQIESNLLNVPVTTVNESNSTLEARDRYWIMYPPQGFQRLIPQGLRIPPRPVDDIVAIILIERYLQPFSVE
jgi:RNase H-fold protein (predicted Holliday junction resolvase)